MSKLWTDEECTPFLTGFRPAEILSWYDADTPKVEITLGFGVKTQPGEKGYIRLLAEGAILTPEDRSDDGVDAWEMRGSERELGKAAKARVLELIPVGSQVRLWSFKGSGKTGKYGRWLCVILYQVAEGWRSLAETLLEEGHAELEHY